MPKWLLPEHIADVLPVEACKIEALRRQLLDIYRSYGYELVIPPMLEYIESLLTGTGQDLDLRTFKLIDQLSGRTMGLRADITPQVARIDAHLLNRTGVVRLSYAGSVLHTRPRGLHATRQPLQIGAEIYGYAGLEADIEVIELALASARAAQSGRLSINLSHMGILQALMADLPLSRDAGEELMSLVQAKDIPGLRALGQRLAIDAVSVTAWVDLCRLYGGREVLAQARQLLPNKPAIHTALDALATLAQSIHDVDLTIDLSELRGFQYHSGLMFAVYCDRLSNALIRGGRYDEIGKSFGRARPATGFSLDLRDLAELRADLTMAAIEAPAHVEAESAQALRQTIERLRAAGEIVVQAFPAQESGSAAVADSSYDRELRFGARGWEVHSKSNQQ